MKTFQRLISFLLCVVMVLQFVPVTVLAQESGDGTVPDADQTPSGSVVTEENLTVLIVDADTGEESRPGDQPYDLAYKDSWQTHKVVPVVWTEDGEYIPITTGKTEFFWCFSMGYEGMGSGPIGMMPGKWAQIIQRHQEDYPDDYENVWLINGMDGWTEDPTVPAPLTAGELLGIDGADYYLNQHCLALYVRHTTDEGEQILMQWPEYFNSIQVCNSEGLEDYMIPTEYPYAVGAQPMDWGMGNAAMPSMLSISEESGVDVLASGVPDGVTTVDPVVPGGDGSGGDSIGGGVIQADYLTVYADIEEWDTPVVYWPHAVTETDGMVGPGAYCYAGGLDNGNCGCYEFLWVTLADGVDVLDMENGSTPLNFIPVGIVPEVWERLCNRYADEYPEKWAAGDYSGLYEDPEVYEYWMWTNRLPVYSDANISGEDYDHSYVLSDYSTRTYACVVRWQYYEYIYEDGYYVGEKLHQLYGYGDPVTIIPDDGTNIPDDPLNPDVPADKHKPASPLPESDTKGLEWFAGFDLTCDAEYGKQKLTYQWYRSVTNEYNGIPIDPEVEYTACDATYRAQYPDQDELDKTYYYYCEYSFVNGEGETETHRTTICALRRAPCSMLEITVSPGAFYLEPDPDNTDYYSPEYIRYSNATLDVSDPDDYTLTYAYQVYGGESVLSAWIEPEDLYCSDGFIHSDYITWQWYRSDTEDWTTGIKVGEEGKVEGLTEISLRKPLVSGTMSLINFNAFNKHANIHVDCPTDTLEPFYMTIVITNHYTDSYGEHVTSTSTARCKVFTFEENEDLYSVDENGMLDGYNGHESTWNIPAEIDGVKVTSIGEMANPVAPLPPSSDKCHYSGPTKIVIPEGVTEICDCAFFRLYSLEEVELPSTLKRIGKHAFCDSGAIESMKLPASVEEIGGGAFYLSRIKEFIFDENVWPVIGGGAFTQSWLRQVVFPANATGTLEGKQTFYDSQNLGSVVNWQNIQELDRQDDFLFTPAYEYLVEGSGGQSDGNFIYLPDEEGTGWMVVQCIMEDVETVEIPAYFQGKPVTTVGRGKGLGANAAGATIQLVEDVLAIRHLILPETVHTINTRAFDGCEYLETVTFHENIKLVKEQAFNDCYRLTSTVKLAAGAHILQNAFSDCRSITRLDAPGAYIFDDAFNYCVSLEHISAYKHLLPEYNYSLYAGGYQYWPFAYTKTYTDANDSAVYYRDPDQKMSEAETPHLQHRRHGDIYYELDEKDHTQGTIVLYGGANDYEVTLPGMIPAEDGTGYVYLTNVEYGVFDHMTTEYHDVVFEEGISVLEYYSGSTSWRHPRMRNVTLPQSLTDINNFFQGGYGDTGLLESINIPSGVIVLKEEAFTNNPNLHTVTFDSGSKLELIEESTFSGCESLKNVDLSNLPELTRIGSSAFNGCDLSGVDLTGSPKLKVIEKSAFAGMMDLQYIRLPDNLEEIGAFAFEDGKCIFGSNPSSPDEYHEVVGSLNPLKELILPANLKKIGKGAFLGQFMDNTDNEPFVLELPEGLEWIGNEAFGGYNTAIYVDMELWSNVVLKDGKLPESLKIFGNYSDKAYVDDNNDHVNGGPFARSIIDTLVFPAGIEILGDMACYNMPKLTKVVFEAKDQIVKISSSEKASGMAGTLPGKSGEVQLSGLEAGAGEKVLYTSSLRELHPDSLASVIDEYHGWSTITTIEGFENLRMLEYMEDVFGATADFWTFPEDSYTLPDTVRHLGKYALSNGSTSPFKNITLPTGIEQIDNYALSNKVAQVGTYITTLEMAPRDTSLAQNWINLSTTDRRATLRCYKGSSFHIWAEENDYPCELIDPDSSVVFLDLTENNNPVPHPETWLESCVWTDSDGNVVSTDYIFRNAKEGETYTVTVSLNFEKLQDYTLPYKTATVTLQPGEDIAYVQLPVSYRESVTIKGILPQTGILQFSADIVQSKYPYARIAWINPDPLTGEFTLELPRVDCKLVMKASDDTPYVTTEYTNLLWSKPVVNDVIDLGVLPMDLGPMFVIPIADGVDLSRCSSLKVTTEDGDSYYATLVERYLTAEDYINDIKTTCLYIKNAIRGGVTIGDKLTLTSFVDSTTCEQVIPYTFEVPKHNINFSIKPEVKSPVRIIKKTGGYLYLFDADGNALHDSPHGINWMCLEPGTYTAICIEKIMDVRSLDAFKELNIPVNAYLQDTFTVTSKYGDNIVIDWTLPRIDAGAYYGITMSYDATVPDSNGYIPVYIHMNVNSLIPEGDMQFEVKSDGLTSDFAAVNGQMVIPDKPGTVKDVQYISGGGRNNYNRLIFTTSLREGVLTMYVKPDGNYLHLLDPFRNSLATLLLPKQSFVVSPPSDILTADSGVLNLFCDFNYKKQYSAVVIVDDEETSPVKLSYSGGTALPYSLKTYADGSSTHTIQVVVRDQENNDIWYSDVWSVMHTNQSAPEPQQLDIRITNLNATWENGTHGKVDGVKTVENAFLNFVTGEYAPMKFVVPYWNYNQEDGTMAKDITFDYSLTIKNAHLIEDQDVTLKVYFRESDPYVKHVRLYYNILTGTFEGSLHIPGNTIPINDVPYGVVLDYTSQTTTEELSHQFVIDQGNARAEMLEELIGNEPVVYETLDLDALYYYFEQEGFSPEDRDVLVEYFALFNELTLGVNEMNADMAESVSVLYGMDSDATPMEVIQQYLDENGMPDAVQTLGEPITAQELLEMGFVEYKFDKATLYIMSNLEFTQVVCLNTEHPENSLVMNYGAPQTFALNEGSGENQYTSELVGNIRLVLGLVYNVLSKMNLILSELEESCKMLDPIVAKMQVQDEIVIRKNVDNVSYVETTVGKYVDENFEKLYAMLGSGDDELVELAGDLLTEAVETPQKTMILTESYKVKVKSVEKVMREFEVVLSMPGAETFGPAAKKLLNEINSLKTFANKITLGMGKTAKIIPAIGPLVSASFFLFDCGMLIYTCSDYADNLNQIQANYDEMNELLNNMVNNVPEDYCIDEDDVDRCTKALSNMRILMDAMGHNVSVYTDSKKIVIVADSIALIAELVAALNPAWGIADDVLIGGLSLGYGFASAGVSTKLDSMHTNDWNSHKTKLDKQVDLFYRYIQSVWYWCGEGIVPPGKSPVPPQTPDEDPHRTPNQCLIDPSGYVYEAVASNRIEGATAQVYYQGSDGTEVFWDEASLYDQVNPQVTDSFGTYGWMTPPGNWLVKITKEGYLPADSKNDPEAVDGWLPVPPPQLNVNIAMVSEAAPEIIFAAAAPDRVQLIFSQYMDIAYLNANPGMIQVTQDGETVPVAFSFSDSEESPTNAGIFYGRILNITRTDGNAFSGDNIRVTVSKDIRNYASNTMETAFDSGAMKAKPLADAISHSYPNRLVIYMGDEVQIRGMVLDTQGKPMAGASVDLSATYGDILQFEGAATAVSDATGVITFQATALRPGTDYLVFSTVNGVKAQMEVRVEAVNPEVPSKPTANLTDYQTVSTGTQLILACATEGAIIYYTTDDTCPCEDGAGRKVYSGPITIEEETLFRIASWTETGGYSERLNLRILVNDSVHTHGTTLVPAVDPDCENTGKEAYYTCSCGKYFEDKQASKEITDLNAYGIIPKLGHDPVAHNAKAATCTDIGWDAYETCSRCDYSTYVEIGALDHDYDTSTWNPGDKTGHWHDCKRCDAHDTPADHVPNIGAATEEYDKYCVLCGFIIEPKLSHVHSMRYTAKVEPDCENPGKEAYYTCSDGCGKHFADEAGTQEISDLASYGVISALGHDRITHNAKAATCTDIGWDTYETCSRCDYSTYVEIGALGHDRITHNAKAATCTDIGWNAYETCSRCDYTTYVEIPAAHQPVNDNGYAATCTEAGLTNGSHCGLCGEVLVAQTAIPALEHDWDEGYVTIQPGCDSDGEMRYTCGNDSSHTRTETIPAVGHQYDDGTCTECGVSDPDYVPPTEPSEPEKPTRPNWGNIWAWLFGIFWGDEDESCDHRYTTAVTAPTCTERGYTTHTCTECGDSYKDSYTSALGHAWDDGKVTREVTCTENGIMTYTCETCGKTRNETIATPGHKFQNGSCSICGKQQGSISPDRPTRPSWGFIWETIFSWWN